MAFVSIRSEIDSALLELRGHAESLMPDTCTVSRADPNGAVDPATGEPERVQVYSGPAKRQTYESYEQSPEAGGHMFAVQRYSVHFPVGSFEPAPDDVIVWTASAHDPDLPGTRDRITGLFNKSFATAQRVYVEEVVA